MKGTNKDFNEKQGPQNTGGLGQPPDYQRIFEGASGLFLLLAKDPSFTILNASDAYLRAMRTTRDALVGRSLLEVFSGITDEEGVRQVRASLEVVVTGGCPDRVAARRYDTPGSEQGGGRCWSLVNTPVLSELGELLWIVHRVEDEPAPEATASAGQPLLPALDLRWGEWMSVLKQAPFGITLLSMPERRYEFVNDAYTQMAGLDITGLRVGEILPGLLSPRELEHLKKLQDEVFQGDKTVFVNEAPWHFPDGSVRYYNAASQPWLAPDGTKRGILTVSMEVTQQVLARLRAEEANEHVRRSEAALRKSMALREDFLSVASHELRTPLTTLGLQAESLLRAIQGASLSEPLLGRWVHKAERILNQTNRLEQLIEGMLDVVGLGRADPQPNEETDLSLLIQATVERLRSESKQARATIRLCAETTLGRWDRQRIDQIVSQLLLNALKFGVSKPIEVSVSAVGEKAQILVKDRGIGIALEDQARIFGRFERAAPSEHFGGLGLGLWIVSEVVKGLSGSIRVESRLGEGATFIVELPRHL